jgi:type I restriction enzyme S subunit
MDYDKALINQRVAVLKSISVETSFLYVLLGTESVKNYVLEHATALMQPNLSVTDLRNMPIIIPPLPLQQSFAQKIEAIERQKELISKSIEETQKLFDYTMDKYFG